MSIDQENKTQYETVVKEFGNGAHITVPKEWVGDLVHIEHIGPYRPPLFKNVSQNCEVVMDIDLNEDELQLEAGLDETENSVEGEVIKFEDQIQDDGTEIRFTLVIDTGKDFYKIEIKRDSGDDGWSESEYTVRRTMDSDEGLETNEIVTVNGKAMWKPIGTVSTFAVKKQVN